VSTKDFGHGNPYRQAVKQRGGGGRGRCQEQGGALLGLQKVGVSEKGEAMRSKKGTAVGSGRAKDGKKRGGSARKASKYELGVVENGAGQVTGRKEHPAEGCRRGKRKRSRQSTTS